MKSLKLLGLGCLLSIYTTIASAELLIDPTDKSNIGKGKVGVSFGKSKIKYENKSGDKETLKRQYISGYYAYGFSKDIDFFIIGGYSLDAEFEDLSGDSGFMYGGGARGSIPTNNIKINWYGQYIIFDEEYGNNLNGISFEGKIDEFSIGLVAINTSGGITSYGGVEYIVESDGKVKGSTGDSFDIERKEDLGFRIGARKKINNTLFSINAGLKNETSFSISASSKF